MRKSMLVWLVLLGAAVVAPCLAADTTVPVGTTEEQQAVEQGQGNQGAMINQRLDEKGDRIQNRREEREKRTAARKARHSAGR